MILAVSLSLYLSSEETANGIEGEAVTDGRTDDGLRRGESAPWWPAATSVLTCFNGLWRRRPPMTAMKEGETRVSAAGPQHLLFCGQYQRTWKEGRPEPE